MSKAEKSLSGIDVKNVTYELALASEGEIAAIDFAAAGCGLDEDLLHLAKHPMAKAARGQAYRTMDRVNLTQLEGKRRFIQWHGRCYDGRYRPFGRIMKIIEIKP